MARSPALAATRFGLGLRPGDLAHLGRDGRDWLHAQLAGPLPAPPELAQLPSTAALAARLPVARERTTEAGREAMREARKELIREGRRELLPAEQAARAAAQVASEAPLVERLVVFWSNHLTVSTSRIAVAGLVGAYEREAIRPRVLGPFRELLVEAVRHPAMILYLDNQRSVGPDSQVARRSARDRDDVAGLNENLAREVLELHTLGVDGGYDQADVGALAEALTGWSLGPDGMWRYRPAAHQPGQRSLLGTRLPPGEREALAALELLAAHPATHRRLARRLVTHLLPTAPEDLVQAVASEVGGGTLAGAVARIVDHPAAWVDAPGRLKQPWELVISAARAVGWAEGADSLARSMALLGQPTWGAPSPAGWPDDDATWASPEGTLHRVEWCANLARARLPAGVGAEAHAEAVLGDRLDRATRKALARAPDPTTGLALLLASPAFQRR